MFEKSYLLSLIQVISVLFFIKTSSFRQPLKPKTNKKYTYRSNSKEYKWIQERPIYVSELAVAMLDNWNKQRNPYFSFPYLYGTYTTIKW